MFSYRQFICFKLRKPIFFNCLNAHSKAGNEDMAPHKESGSLLRAVVARLGCYYAARPLMQVHIRVSCHVSRIAVGKRKVVG